jgi:hypothetical protein
MREYWKSLQRLCGNTGSALVALGIAVLSSTPAHTLPSFARQTGMPCSQCHTVAYGPQLTAYGRQFKLNGYVWGDAKQVIPPVALMIQGGFTHTSKDQIDQPAPHFAVNDNLSVDQVSAFYGGRITSQIGAFAQVTYSGEDRHYHWDNLDVRYAHSATIGNTGLVFGISVNNNPTVQDLWNSTPAWGFPYISSALAPTPSAAPVLAGALRNGCWALRPTPWSMIIYISRPAPIAVSLIAGSAEPASVPMPTRTWTDYRPTGARRGRWISPSIISRPASSV